MPELDDTAEIEDEEYLFRRIPVSQGWYDPAVSSSPSPRAFRPRDDDTTGLSLVRGNPFNSVEQAARGPSRRGYYVAVLRAGDLRTRGLVVTPRPIAGVAGHAEITNLTVANRDSDEALSLMTMLAHELCIRVEGPFLT